MTEPPADAYGRATNPERYGVVVEAARQLVDELRVRFDVDELRGPQADPDLADDDGGAAEVVRLVPRSGAAAPLTFAFTDFPAVVVRTGEWHRRPYPSCGCDACDERPDDVVAEMRRDVGAVIAGGVTEAWDGERLHRVTSYPDGGRASSWSLVTQDRDRFGEPRRLEWAPWPPAGAGAGS